MKTLKNISIAILALIVFTTCDINQAGEDPLEEQVLANIEQENSARKRFNNKRAVPFKAKFFTVIKGDEVGFKEDECPISPFTFFNVQVGSGEATHLGKFTTRITFCVDITDLLDDGTLTGDESAPYNNGKGTFIAANGDKLHFTISGVVVPSDNPDFDFEFQDPFTFTGGTGRFAGATGDGITNSFVDQETDRTDHIWKATLILPMP